MANIQKLRTKQFFSKTYSRFRSDKAILYSTIASFFLIFTSFLLLYFKASDFPSQVPLFYSLPWGKERLVSPTLLLILPGASFAVFIVNTFFAAVFFEKENLLSKILVFSSVFILFLSFYTLIRIVFLIS